MGLEDGPRLASHTGSGRVVVLFQALRVGLVDVVELVNRDDRLRGCRRRRAAAVAFDLDLGLGLGHRVDVTVRPEVVPELNFLGGQHRDEGALGELDLSRSVRFSLGRHRGVEPRTTRASDLERHGSTDLRRSVGRCGLLDVLLVLDLHHRRVHHVNVTTHAVSAGLDELAVHDVVNVLVQLQPLVPLQNSRHLDGPLEAANDVAVLAGVADDASGLRDDDGLAAGLLGNRLGLLGAGLVLDRQARRLLQRCLRDLDVVIRVPPGKLGRTVDRQSLTVLDGEACLSIAQVLGDDGELEVTVGCVAGRCHDQTGACREGEAGESDSSSTNSLDEGVLVLVHDVLLGRRRGIQPRQGGWMVHRRDS